MVPIRSRFLLIQSMFIFNVILTACEGVYKVLFLMLTFGIFSTVCQVDGNLENNPRQGRCGILWSIINYRFLYCLKCAFHNTLHYRLSTIFLLIKMAHYNLNFVFPSYFSLQCTNIQAVVVLDEYRNTYYFYYWPYTRTYRHHFNHI